MRSQAVRKDCGITGAFPYALLMMIEIAAVIR